MKMVEAAEAAQALGVSVTTLYAYVSRGLLQSYPGPGQRSKLYRWDEVERLLLRKRRPEEAVRSALDWGAPVIESRLTHIESSRLWYRGLDACQLAAEASLEEVAALLWGTPVPDGSQALLSLLDSHKPFLGGALSWLAECQEQDSAAWDLRPEAVVTRGWLIFQGLLTLLAPPAVPEETVAQRLTRLHSEAALLQSCLILCADHELNSSAFAARVVASTLATPYAVVTAGLAALSGPRHGGACLQVEALLDEADQKGFEATLAARLRRGEAVPGFGHRLYPDGDPRARFLLDRIPPSADSVPSAQSWAEVGTRILGQPPGIDFALVVVARHLGLPAGTAFKLFATGRALGWIAHALEQYQDGRMLRPRAHYTGPATGAGRAGSKASP